MVRRHVSLATFRRAQKRNAMRTRRARRLDRRRTYNVTSSYKKWSKRPGRYDFRGIDTRRRKRRTRK